VSARPVAVGLVGCGRLAEVGYLPALAASRGLHLVAVADPDVGRCDHVAALGSQHQATPVGRFADAASLLDQVEVDALILATPAATHLADARIATAAGVAVLVEKPPAPDAPTADELARLDPTPWVGFNRRFDAGAQAARSRVPLDGELDLSLELSYRRGSWQAHAVHDDALLDLGPHLVDWARWLTGSEVMEVTAAEVEPTRATVELTLGRGRARISAAVDRPYRERIEVRDARGTVVARHRRGGLPAAVRDRLSGNTGPHALVATLAGQLDALAGAVRGEPSGHLGTAHDGHATMLVVDAARSSAAHQGRPVAIPQTQHKDR
jgi:predicted dehydrogenase